MKHYAFLVKSLIVSGIIAGFFCWRDHVSHINHCAHLWENLQSAYGGDNLDKRGEALRAYITSCPNSERNSEQKP